MKNINKDQRKTLKILAVDDEKDVCEYYKKAISFYNQKKILGFYLELTTCYDGESAVKAVMDSKRDDNPYAIVLLDLQLQPKKDGIWTGKQIREIDSLANFVIVTGFEDYNLEEIIDAIPPRDKIFYIQKPIHLKELQQFINSLGSKWISDVNHLLLQKKLKYANQELIETNNALLGLTKSLDKIRKESEDHLALKVKNTILPIVKKLKNDNKLTEFVDEFIVLENYIQDLTDNISSSIKIASILTATELRIAAMIKTGKNLEDISKSLCVTKETVKTHRKNIRKKLNLNRSGINLKAYLTTEMDVTMQDKLLS